MRLRSIASEAWRNVVCAPYRTLGLALLSAALCGALATLELDSMASLREEGQEFHRVGGRVQILAAQERVDPELCERLSDLTEVRVSAPVRMAEERVGLLALPDAPLPLLESTPALLPLLRVAVAADDATLYLPDTVGDLSADLADRSDDGSGTPAFGYFLVDDRGPRLEYTAVAIGAPRGSQMYDECWAEIDTTRESGVLRLALSASGDPNDRGELLMLNPSAGSAPNLGERWVGRASRSVEWMALAFGIVLGGVTLGLRRTSLASHLVLGVGRANLGLQLALEAACWYALAILPALAAILALNGSVMREEPGAGLLLVLEVFAALWVGVLVATAAGMRSVSPRLFYRYFRRQD